MQKFNPTDHQHIRFNPLKDEWVLVSPHRSVRPWSGQTEPSEEEEDDPGNPLKPNAVRANGQKNPPYTSTYVFPNDFPALLERVPEPPVDDDPLFQMAPAKGTCRVMCFHPNSRITLPLMTVNEIIAIINEWMNQMNELGRKYIWIQIFENKGAMMGCSNPHPHCQIWSSSFLPNEARTKDRTQKEYYNKHGKPLLEDYREKELIKKERIILENEEWVALVPYWAIWPYEAMVLPKNSIQRMTDMDSSQKSDLADIIKRLTTKYDNLFECRFPYSMGWHGAPTGPLHKKGDSPHWIFHGIWLPPLLRSAAVKKFMVGYELLSQAQRDLTSEKAAEILRNCDESHYLLRK